MDCVTQVNKAYSGTPAAILLHRSPPLVVGGDAFTCSKFDGCLTSAVKIVSSACEHLMLQNKSTTTATTESSSWHILYIIVVIYWYYFYASTTVRHCRRRYGFHVFCSVRLSVVRLFVRPSGMLFLWCLLYTFIDFHQLLSVMHFGTDMNWLGFIIKRSRLQHDQICFFVFLKICFPVCFRDIYGMHWWIFPNFRC